MVYGLILAEPGCEALVVIQLHPFGPVESTRTTLEFGANLMETSLERGERKEEDSNGEVSPSLLACSGRLVTGYESTGPKGGSG